MLQPLPRVKLCKYSCPLVSKHWAWGAGKNHRCCLGFISLSDQLSWAALLVSASIRALGSSIWCLTCPGLCGTGCAGMGLSQLQSPDWGCHQLRAARSPMSALAPPKVLGRSSGGFM